jgi:hypothetical protein
MAIGGEDHRDVGAEVQLAGQRLALAATDEEGAEDRGEHPDRADEQREQEGRLLQRAPRSSATPVVVEVDPPNSRAASTIGATIEPA